MQPDRATRRPYGASAVTRAAAGRSVPAELACPSARIAGISERVRAYDDGVVHGLFLLALAQLIGVAAVLYWRYSVRFNQYVMWGYGNTEGRPVPGTFAFSRYFGTIFLTAMALMTLGHAVAALI